MLVCQTGLCKSHLWAIENCMFQNSFSSQTADHRLFLPRMAVHPIFPISHSLLTECSRSSLLVVRHKANRNIFGVCEGLVDTGLKQTGIYIYNLTDTTEALLVARDSHEWRLYLNYRNTLTLTRMDALAGLDHRSPKITPMRLTKPGSCFKFDTSHMDIEFVECAATEDIRPVRKWLESL